MNSQERVLKALNHEESDNVPSFELSIDNLKICNHFSEEYVFQGMVKSFRNTYDLVNGDIEQLTKTILKATETRSYIKITLRKHTELYRKIGIDMCTVPFTGYILFPKICEKTHFVDEYGRIFDLRRNPSDNMDIAYYRDGFFKNFEEYNSFSPYEPDNPRREKYFKAMKKTEDDYNGKLSIIPSIWGVFEPTWQVFGFVNFSKLLTNHRIIKKVFDDRGKFALELVKTFIDWGENSAILIYDDFGYKAGLLMSPENYKKYVVPWIKELCRVAHKSDLKIILHSCGDVFPIFEDLINAGIDAIHPLEPTTANSEYDIFKLHEKYGDKITFIGNVSPQDLADKDSEYIKTYTKKLLKNIAPGGGYILSSGHSINPSVKLENFLMMYKILKKFGKYPINIK